MIPERIVQAEIRVALSDSCVLFRANVGRVKLPDGRMFDTGLPVGFSDLFGFRKSDGRAVFIEVKRPGGRVRKEQEHFISAMAAYGALAGIAHSVEEARGIVNGI